MWRKNCPSVVIQRFFAVVCFLLLAICCENTVAKDINVLVGSSIDLPCTVDTEQCGELHSVKWYRDTSRIYVYSQLGLISRAEGNATKRITVEYQLNNTEALLRINKVELLDEASYKCEITYLEVRENCDVVQIIRLQTMVQPDPPRILSTLGSPPLQGNIANTTFGPNEEGTEIELVCQAIGGKPKPQVKWYNGSREMTALYETTQDTDGLFTETAKLNIILTRGDLKARYECQVTSAALQQPMAAFLDMEVYVKPLYMKLEYQEQVVQGNDVQLICDVFGANPAADVKWFNNSKLITNESLVHTVPEAMPILTKVEGNRNGTFTTKSQLQFKATRYDNGQIFHCYAENSVIRNQDSLFHKQVLIQVKYAPVVSVNPENTTTNETAQNILIGCRYTANPMELKAVYWMKNGKNLTLTKDKYEGGTTLHPPLLIKNVTREDMGEYICVCMNDVGVSESENSAYLNVQYPPTVEVIMDPETPVKAVDGVNVTAMCNVVAGNPPTLLKVRWFLGDDLLKELPECNYTSNDVDGYGGLYCNVDPSILSLVTVDQSFAGNYTCRGMNIFGWGLLSEPTELVVYYPPGSTKLTYIPSKVVKRGQVDLHCSVERAGRPKNLTYIWYRGIHKMSGEHSSTLTINPVKLDTRNNFTCIAKNAGGMSEPATVFINVSAPPAFITPLKYQHVRSFQSNMSLTCRVECSPLCYISWFRENEQIDTRNNRLYDIKTTIRDANGKTGDFESIESTLIWNVDAWPTHPFAKTAPTVHYMCISSSNGVGNGVNASVPVEVEYPPENLTLSNNTVSVVEGKFPAEVTCTGKGFPHLHYFWRKQNSSKILSYTQGLIFEAPLTKAESGNYVCEANNTHGTAQAVLKLEVEYPPHCVITKGEYNGQSALLCIVDANPNKVTFNWKIQGANDTIDDQLNTRQEGIRGFLLLDSGVETLRTYQCFANNSAGFGSRCVIDVTAYQEQSSQIGAPGETLKWWHIFGTGNNVILIAIIVGIILCAIFVCIIIIIIICVCKRRRARNKYNNPVEMEEREKFLCTQSPDVLGLPLVPCGRVTYLGNSVPNQSIIADRGRSGGQHNDGLTDPLTIPDKGFYENLPFHGMQTPPNKNAFYTLTTPHFKHVANPQLSQQYAATIPHQKHTKLLPRALFQDQQISKSKSFSSRTKQKKHFQIPLQKCHSFKFQTAESYFQPIKNVHEENFIRNGYVSDFGPGYNEREHSRSHKRDKYKNKGPLVLRRPSDYQDNSNELHNMVQLQYPQPLYCKKKDNPNRPNGIVYADLDMPKTSNSSSKKGAQVSSSLSKLQKSKPKTEYATLNFNEVGKEIDV